MEMITNICLALMIFAIGMVVGMWVTFYIFKKKLL